MAFVPRLTSAGMQGNKWWYQGGSFPYGNPFVSAGYGLPNCTCYAYGRAAEIMNAWQNLPTGNATDWRAQAENLGWEILQEPVLGSIMVWSRGPGETHGGHVCVVEEILDDVGTINTSNSGWGGPYFFTKTYSKPYVYGSTSRNYYFNGFVNVTSDTPGGGSGFPDADWHATPTGGFLRDSVEAFENAIMIYKILYGYGFKLNSVCAILGNISGEGVYNPWRWESDIISDINGRNGYGLFQYTPASKYLLSQAQNQPEYAPNYIGASYPKPHDGAAQLWYLETFNRTEYLPTAACPETYEEFKTSTQSIEYLTEVFMRNFERPASYSSLTDRQNEALYWYDILKIYDPERPSPLKKSGLPLYMMIKPWYI